MRSGSFIKKLYVLHHTSLIFKACPFSHFASHGLKLKERQFFKLEAPDIGQLFHSALKLISDRLHELKLDWRDLTMEQLTDIRSFKLEKLTFLQL